MNSPHSKLLSLTHAVHPSASSEAEKGGALLHFRGNRRMAVCQMALFALFAFPLFALRAADGTYTSTSGGAWNVAGSWGSSVIASGSGSTAYFNTLDLTTDLSLSLGANQTIGNLLFGDTAPSNHGWTIAGNTLTLAGTTPTVTVNDLGTGTATLNSFIAGTAGLKKEGSGTLVLGGTNSYTGGTTISAGTLISNTSGAVRGDVSITSGAVWTVNADTSSGVVHGLSGSGSLNGTRTVVVGGNNATSTFDGAIAMTPSASFSAFTKIGSGTLTLTNTVSVNTFFTYQGGWTEVDLSKWQSGFHYFFGGNLRVTGANSTANDQQMRVNANTTVDTNGHDTNFASLYVYNTTPFTLTKAGAGAMILNGTQTGNSGIPAIAINLEQGTLRSTVSGAYSAGLLTMSAGTLFDLNGVADLTTINRGLSGTGTVTTTGTNQVTFAYGNFAGNIEAGRLYKNQSGTLTLSGTHTYTGTTTVAAGTLVVTGSLANSSSYSISSGAKLQIGNDTTAGSLNGSSIANAGTLEFKRSNALTFNNAITGAGTVTQSGAGTTTLSSSTAYVYTGATVITGGTLVIGGTSSINSSSGVTVNGGTLNYSSSVNLTAPLTFTSGTLAGTNYAGKTLSIGTNQTIAPGNSTGTLTSAALTWAPGGTYQWQINDATGIAGSTGWDLLSVTGTLTLSATSGTPFNLQIVSLSFQLPGMAANFDPSLNYAWVIADAASAITTFDASAFQLSLSGFQNGYTGVWGVALGGSPGVGGDNSQVFLTYSAIPEPASSVLLVGGLFVRWFSRKKFRVALPEAARG